MLNAEVYVPSYWLLGDDQLDLSKNASQQDAFKANFKHSLLFNPSLLLSDSMAINSRNFRHLIESDGEFRSLVEGSNFSIAVRVDDHNNPADLITLKHNFIKSGKSRVTELDDSDAGLSFLQNAAIKVPYSIKLVSQIFSEQSIDIFLADSIQERLPNNLWRDVYEIAKQTRYQQAGTIGLDFFFYHLRDQLIDHRMGRHSDVKTEIDKYIEEIKTIAQYPYITALPNTIDTTPIYANKHADAFRICRGRSGLKSIDSRKDIRLVRLVTDLASFGTLISRLSADDIIDLRNSSEALAYYKARFDFDIDKYESSKRDLHLSLANYVHRIGTIILERFGTRYADDGSLTVEFEQRKYELVKWLDHVSDIYTYVTVGVSAINPEIALPAVASLLFVIPMIKIAKRTLASMFISNASSPDISADEKNLQALQADELRQTQPQDDRIRVNVLISKTKNDYVPDETIYTSNYLS